MKQTTLNSAHPVSDLGALRLQLDEDGKVYCGDSDSEEGRKRLLHTLQINDCREIITAVVDGDDLADTFVLASYCNHVDILEAFLHHGMNIDVKGEGDWTALMYASCYRQEEAILFLLNHNANVNVQDKSGVTALIQVSMNGFTKIVEMLLAKNANPNIQDKNGMTALMYASVNGDKEIVQVLLDRGADIELKSNNENTALDLAKNDEIRDMIRNHVPSSYVLK